MPKKQNRKEHLTIGWREWISLPKLGKTKVKAKVDTGAHTASLHAYDIKIVKRKGKKKVRFEIHPNQDNRRGRVTVEAPLVEFRPVKSSSGHKEKRPVIMTPIEVMGQMWSVEVTLTNRDLMGFRMLLGRSSIKNRFVVDVSQSFISKKTNVKKRGQA